jgi:catechol 2,3-dioxygenase-like lactoylglutathione lyase family enzyme
MSDDRPGLWVGHVALATHDLPRAAAFYESLGGRLVTNEAWIAEIEMRGGTHLALVLDANAKTEGRVAPFDLMVDDVNALHAQLEAAGVEVSPVNPKGHNEFTFHDPDGHVVTVNGNHVVGPV